MLTVCGVKRIIFIRGATGRFVLVGVDGVEEPGGIDPYTVTG